MSDVTVIGLGAMGRALAGALARDGRAVTVWNRTPGRLGTLADAGIAEAPTLAEALSASPVILTCLKTHAVTREVLAGAAGALAGRLVLEVSSGSAGAARDLAALLEAAGAGWQIGMINAWPEGIGRAETVILCGGPAAAWARLEPVVKLLGGASRHVGEGAETIPGLFAALFTARQGFLFGLMHGAAVARRSGLPVEVMAGLMPVTLQMVQGYADLFLRTVPGQHYDNASAAMAVYQDSLEDALASFEATGTPDGLPRMMRDLVARAVDEGMGARELTAVTELLARG